MTERSAQGSKRSRRGHQHHPKNMGIRTSNVPTSEIILALREGRDLETLFLHQTQLQIQQPVEIATEHYQQTDNTQLPLAPINGNVIISRLNDQCDDTNQELDTTSNCNIDLKSKRNSSSSSLNSTPSEKSSKKKSNSSKSSEGKKKRIKVAQTDISQMVRPAAEGAEDLTVEDDDAETAEWAKLRCTSERTEVVAERENRRQKRCADYPGLAFGRSIFSSDSMMKFNIIKNELQNIMNNQLRREGFKYIETYFKKNCTILNVHWENLFHHAQMLRHSMSPH